MMEEDIKKPNFFIIGAPKCGTTSLSKYLEDHENVFFSNPKEPGYFATDFSDEVKLVVNKDEYFNECFSEACNYKRAGEGTPFYLFSKEAVDNILDFNPEAKLIIMIRDPVDMFYSWHTQMRRALDENIRDPQKAWHRSQEGPRDHSTCRDPKFLQYGEMCKLGKQVQRTLKKLPDKDQVKIIEFEDFTNNTREVYEEVLEFLGLKNDSRDQFPIYNKTINLKSRVLKSVIKSLTNSKLRDKLKPVSEYIKRKIGVDHWSFLVQIKKWNRERTERKPLSKNFKRELRNYFKEDQQLLREIIEDHEG